MIIEKMIGVPECVEDWLDNFKDIYENIHSVEKLLEDFRTIQKQNISALEELLRKLVRCHPTFERTGKDLSVYIACYKRPVARSVITMPGFEDFQFEISSVLSLKRALNVYFYFLKAVHELPGAICEFGVYLGETSRELCRFIEYAGLPQTVYMFDTFSGLPPTDDPVHDRYIGTEEVVHQTMSGLSQYVLINGLIIESLQQNSFTYPVAFAHIDCDLPEGTRDSILLCERNMVQYGYIVVDDYSTETWPGVTEVCDRLILGNSKMWTVIDKSRGQLVAQKN